MKQENKEIIIWEQDGPSGPDGVIWWVGHYASTHTTLPVGVTSSKCDPRWSIAYINTGEPAGNTNQYLRYEDLELAKQIAEKMC